MKTKALVLGKPVLTLLFALGTTLASAETVLIESRTTGGTMGGITPNPPYQEGAGNWSSSGTHTTAVGTTPGIGSRFASSPTPAPALMLHPTLIEGATYAMEISHISPNAPPIWW